MSNAQQDNAITMVESTDDEFNKQRTKSRSSTLKESVQAVFQIRYIILFMCVLNNFFSYFLRSTINLTIVSMVKPTEASLSDQDNVCGARLEGNETSANLSMFTTINSTIDVVDGGPDRFDWSESMQGVVIGAYFYGYIFTNINAEQLSNIFGCRLLLTLAMSVSSAVTLLIPVLAHVHVYCVIGARFVLGLAQGLTTPAIFALLANWIPRNELGLSYSLIGASGNLGAMITLPVSAILVVTDGWRWPSVFYMFGVISAFFVPVWHVLVYNSPWIHPRITNRELAHLKATVVVKNDQSKKKLSVPWCSIFSSLKIWLISFSRFSGAWGSLLLMNKLPTYLETVLQMPIDLNGYVNSLLYLVLVVSLIIAGRCADYIEQRNWFSRTISRRMFQTLALGSPGLLIGLVPLMGCDTLAVVCLLLTGIFFYGFISGSEFMISIDVAPDYSGTVYGLTNAVANLAGFMAPFFVGVFIDLSSATLNPMEQWSVIFYFTSGMYVLGIIAFWFVKAEPESWAIQKE